VTTGALQHEWLGHRYGPRRWSAAHNPTGEAFRACWRSEPCRRTRQGAHDAG
jgi:hypothetical protein